jgi:hypothetical protein
MGLDVLGEEKIPTMRFANHFFWQRWSQASSSNQPLIL